jgi:hypothetical protein
MSAVTKSPFEAASIAISGIADSEPWCGNFLGNRKRRLSIFDDRLFLSAIIDLRLPEKASDETVLDCLSDINAIGRKLDRLCSDAGESRLIVLYIAVQNTETYWKIGDRLFDEQLSNGEFVVRLLPAVEFKQYEIWIDNEFALLRDFKSTSFPDHIPVPDDYYQYLLAAFPGEIEKSIKTAIAQDIIEFLGSGQPATMNHTALEIDSIERMRGNENS